MEHGSAAVEAGGSLRGRADECARLDSLIEDLRRGESRSLVLRGEAGIGKTALLEYLIASASDLMVLRAGGVESEMELAHASLHQLCAPLLDRLDRLPAPQRQALEVVFGKFDGAAPDRFLVGLGVLSLLSETAEERPVLCVLDDAQWLDRASALTLAFVTRRLVAEGVGIVFAAREPGEALEHVPGLEVRGVHNGDARALLDSVLPSRLDDQVRDRILAETRGNPLALLELPRGLTVTQLSVGFGLDDATALPGRIEESFIRRLEALSDDARRVLLVAAAEPIGDPVLLWQAARKLGIDQGVTDHAEREGLLAIGERVLFRHPLVRSAVYGSSSVEERLSVHLALAEVTDREADPDRRAWHLAAAAPGPDEDVAAELERSAGRAQARGGAPAAAAFLKRSVVLTRDPSCRARRALAAAQAHLQAGAFDAATELLATAEAASPDELGRAQVDLLRGQIAFASSAGSEAPALLLKAARQLEPLDPTLARETYLGAWGAAMFAGRFAGAGDVREVSRAALSAPQPTAPPRPPDLLLTGFALLASEGRAAAAPTLRQAVSGFTEGEITVAERLRGGYLSGVAAIMLWDEQSWRQANSKVVEVVREAGLLVHLPIYLQGLGLLAGLCGDLAAAESAIAEGDAVAEATGTRLARYAALFREGIRGREAEAVRVIEAEMENASVAGEGFGIQYCRWILGILYNGLGLYEKALSESQQAAEEAPELLISGWSLPELIEAAARAGQARVASEALERLAEATHAATAAETDWGLGVLARSRALLREGATAEDQYREAIERLGRTQVRTELARAHLVYGEWLRRENRRLDAREQLRLAHELFSRIGMEAFAERARGELRATGAHVRGRTMEARDDLTPQERQIAELARDGLSNPEIGARLFLSPRTVEWHLRHVFLKLDIKSRRELAKALPASEAEPIPV